MNVSERNFEPKDIQVLAFVKDMAKAQGGVPVTVPQIEQHIDPPVIDRVSQLMESGFMERVKGHAGLLITRHGEMAIDANQHLLTGEKPPAAPTKPAAPTMAGGTGNGRGRGGGGGGKR